MRNFNPSALLQKERLQKKQGEKTDQTPAVSLPGLSPWKKLLKQDSPEQKQEESPSRNPGVHRLHVFEEYLDRVVEEHSRNPAELLKLNPSRKESLGRFLSELARQPEPADSAKALCAFIAPDRSAIQHQAVVHLYRQIVVVHLAKVLLLRSWCERGLCTFDASDFRDPNAALDRMLRGHATLARPAWQITQKNFFSWYKPNPQQEKELLDLFQGAGNMTDDEVRDWILELAIATSANTLGERDRYTRVLYKSLWKAIEANRLLREAPSLPGFQPGARFGYCPTLREGSVFQDAPPGLEWIGFESINFELIFAELRILWNGPRPPLLWAKGSGLEMRSDGQGQLPWNPGSVDVIDQIDDINSCDIAWILEETIIKPQGRSLAAQALRRKVDDHPRLKKLKHLGTSRGMFQALQSLEKLRSGGIMVWVREELLTDESGKPILNELIQEAQILLIADLSALRSEDATVQRDLPKALYLFRRESNIELRQSHRPVMVKAFGALHAESDVHLLFHRLFQLIHRPDVVFPPEPFSLNARISPLIQAEWENRWMNPADDVWVDRIEHLKRNSESLANLCTIRLIQERKKNAATVTPEAIAPVSENGFFVVVTHKKNESKIETASGQNDLFVPSESDSEIFWIAPMQPEWSAPLRRLVESSFTRDWLNYHAERRRGCWIIRELDLKSLPVPTELSQALRADSTSFDQESVTAELDPLRFPTEHIQARLKALAPDRPILRGFAFWKAAHALEFIEQQSKPLFSLLLPDDELDWSRLFEATLSPAQLTSLDRHPLVRIQGPLPDLATISQITRIKTPGDGLLLTSEKSIYKQLLIFDPWLLQVVEESITRLLKQVGSLSWKECLQNLLIPKDVPPAQEIATQVVQGVHAERLRMRELHHLLGASLNPVDMGLLQ
jgi:hypothetical protein